MTPANETNKVAALSLVGAVAVSAAVVLWTPFSPAEPPLVVSDSHVLRPAALRTPALPPLTRAAPRAALRGAAVGPAAPGHPAIGASRVPFAHTLPAESPLAARSLATIGSAAPAVPSAVPPSLPETGGLASAFVRTGRAIGSSFQETGTRIAGALRAAVGS